LPVVAAAVVVVAADVVGVLASNSRVVDTAPMSPL
jgi:hypothetical protein